MPLSSEQVANRPLGGREALECIVNDVRAILEKDGFFAPYVAYGRLAYEVTIKIHMANPLTPEHTVRVRSRAKPEEPAIEGPPPLVLVPDPLTHEEPENVVLAVERSREIQSPNVARIANNLPITVTVHTGQGNLKTRELHYDPATLSEQPEPVDRDMSDVVAEEWLKGKKP